MNEIAKKINTNFSTADAEDPKFQYDDRNLILEFTDWKENQVKVKFTETAAVNWQEAGSSGPEDRDDCTYEIINSKWLHSHLNQRMIEPFEGHRHFKLCFNACGIFEVIATKMERIQV